MKTVDIIEGLQILETYRSSKNGFSTGAEHDQIYACATDNPVDEDDVKKLAKLGWFQESAACSGDDGWVASDYDPDEGWTAYV